MIKINTVTTPSFSMDYFKFGRGEKTLAVLPGLSVQSVMKSADAAAKAYSELEDDFTVYVFDRRKELPPVYKTEEMAFDTAEAITALGLGRVSIFGASQGAMIAIKLAANHPELIEKLVIASATKRLTEKNKAIFDKWIGLAKERDAEKLYLSFGELIYPRNTFGQLRPLLSVFAKSVTGDELKRFMILAEPIKDFDGTRELEKIACPTLIVGDKSDRVFGGGAANAIYGRMKQNPNAGLYVYDGYGHACYDTAPDFKAMLLRFLRYDICPRP